MADEQDQREWSADRWVQHKQSLGPRGTGIDHGEHEPDPALDPDQLEQLSTEDFFERIAKRGRP